MSPTLAIVGKSAEFKKVIVLSTKHWGGLFVVRKVNDVNGHRSD